MSCNCNYLRPKELFEVVLGRAGDIGSVFDFIFLKFEFHKGRVTLYVWIESENRVPEFGTPNENDTKHSLVIMCSISI